MGPPFVVLGPADGRKVRGKSLHPLTAPRNVLLDALERALERLHW
jgi:hypothetical protein